MTGHKYGLLTVIEEDVEKSTPETVKWKCLCDCGNTVIVAGRNLRSGNTTSCGCNQRKIVSQMFKKYNTYDLSGEFGIGYDCNENTFSFDLEDYDLIKDYCWNVHKEYRKKDDGNINSVGYYVTCKSLIDHHVVRLHRLIMGVLDDSSIIVDHIDHNGCNNRRSNLRICNLAQNAWNVKPRTNTTSIYKGVYLERSTGKWVSQITKNKNTYKLGRFKNEEDAALAYNEKAKELFGEFACLNEIKTNKGEINNGI